MDTSYTTAYYNTTHWHRTKPQQKPKWWHSKPTSPLTWTDIKEHFVLFYSQKARVCVAGKPHINKYWIGSGVVTSEGSDHALVQSLRVGKASFGLSQVVTGKPVRYEGTEKRQSKQGRPLYMTTWCFWNADFFYLFIFSSFFFFSPSSPLK